MVREARKRKVILWPMLVAATSFAVAVPVHARDMMGVIDQTGKEIIPCQYKKVKMIAPGFYLAYGFEDGPGVRQNWHGLIPLTTIPAPAKEALEKYNIWAPKILFDFYGKQMKLPLPRNTVLSDIYISEAWRRRLFSADDMSQLRTNLPPDSLIEFLGPNGFGVCDLSGNVLVEPRYQSLSLGGCESGNVYVSTWNSTTKKFDKEKIPIAARFSNYRDVNPSKLDELLSKQKARDGLLVFRDASGKFGYKDEKGSIVIPAIYYDAQPFSEGMAPVRLNPWQGPEVGKHCFIDKTGKIISPIYWRATGFHGKFACVTMKGEPKPIAPHMLPPANLETRNPAAYKARIESLTRMMTRNPEGLIDRNFNYFLPLGEQNISYSNEGYWIVSEARKPALVLDLNGNEVARTPEPAYPVNSGSSSLTFASSHAGPKKLFYYDRQGQLQKTVAGELQRGGGPTSVVRVSGSGPSTVSGIVNAKGDTLLKPENSYLEPGESSRVIKTVFGTAFVREDWLRAENGRGREFEAFLKEYKLIGMPRSEVEEILGPAGNATPDRLVYTLSGIGAWCGNAISRVVIEFEGGKAKRWQYSGGFGQRSKWNEATMPEGAPIPDSN